ncbi:MAG: TatD family hydrolase [Candidatus Aenigmarchaeota archaeon]|nr:TatD family hydrolase [Candidatus Aenigmarchaeota archaeon]
MIDAHCHLEQKDYLKDLDQVIQNCNDEGIKAVVTTCCDIGEWNRALEITKQFKNYVFLSASIHPEFVKEITPRQIDEHLERLRENKKNLVAIGETGLDYFWVREEEWREKQKELFIQHIELSKELKLPLVIHTRDAGEDVLKILEQEDAKNVLLHMWGFKDLIPRVIENKYSITVGPIIAKSKNHKKVVRDMPIENILLETDSPWFGDGVRGTPVNIKIPCGKISEEKKLTFEQVWNKCGSNAIRFFNLDL